MATLLKIFLSYKIYVKKKINVKHHYGIKKYLKFYLLKFVCFLYSWQPYLSFTLLSMLAGIPKELNNSHY